MKYHAVIFLFFLIFTRAHGQSSIVISNSTNAPYYVQEEDFKDDQKSKIFLFDISFNQVPDGSRLFVLFGSSFESDNIRKEILPFSIEKGNLKLQSGQISNSNQRAQFKFILSSLATGSLRDITIYIIDPSGLSSNKLYYNFK